MKPSQASPASVCFAGVTSPSDSAVCLWIKLLACQYSYSFPTTPPFSLPVHQHTHPIGVICRSIWLGSCASSLCWLFGFQCSSSPAPGRQHLFNFLCGAIRAKHPPQLLPSSNLKWKVVCHINTHMRYARPLAERKHKNDMFRPYLWAVNSNTTTTTTRWRNVSSDIWSTHADNPVEQRRKLSTAFSEGFPA